MDTDECQSGLDLASQGALTKPAVRQLGCLIGIYMLPSSDQLFIMERCLLKWTVYLYCLHKDIVEGHTVCDGCWCMHVFMHM